MKIKEKQAISLIVLVITILVLSILAATVIVSISDTDIISETNKTVFKSDLKSYKEAFELYVTSETMKDNSFDSSSLDGTYIDNADTFNKIFGKVEEKYQDGLKIQEGKLVYDTEDEVEKEIAKDLGMVSSTTDTPTNVIGKPTDAETNNTSPYIGYYADVDGDGTVDGVIFADLAYSKSGTFRGMSFKYTAMDTSLLKEYMVSQESYTEAFGTAPVLKSVGNGKNRFYVMALENVTQNTDASRHSSLFMWYTAAGNSGISDYSTVTSTEFGTGKTNTATMIEAWNGEKYGEQDYATEYLDIWGVIQNKNLKYNYNKGWFVPSEEEWSALAFEFNIDVDDYNIDCGLDNNMYLTSSLVDSTSYQRFDVFEASMISSNLANVCWASRLATTF